MLYATKNRPGFCIVFWVENPLYKRINCVIILITDEFCKEPSMNIETVTVEKQDLHRLLASGSGDAAMLYLYIRSGNDSSRWADGRGTGER